jgi:dipeptidase E
MEKIVAIGGGELKDLETLVIDKEIVSLTGKENPRALFIPTASSDAPGYVETFNKIYSDKLGCKTDALLLWSEGISDAQIKEQIASADLVYVGGGNTLSMMNRWKELGVDTMLKDAYKKGTVMSGLSAGSICWFEDGFSDSDRFEQDGKWQYRLVQGLGLIKGIHCPHYHEEKREEEFERGIENYGSIGIALDNNTALEIVNGKFRILSSREEPKAYRVVKRNGSVVTEPIEMKLEFESLSHLYK